MNSWKFLTGQTKPADRFCFPTPKDGVGVTFISRSVYLSFILDEVFILIRSNVAKAKLRESI